MSMTRTPSSGQAASGSNDFSGRLIAHPFSAVARNRIMLDRILATNDDGIDASGLAVCQQIAAELAHEVRVIAPEHPTRPAFPTPSACIVRSASASVGCAAMPVDGFRWQSARARRAREAERDQDQDVEILGFQGRETGNNRTVSTNRNDFRHHWRLQSKRDRDMGSPFVPTKSYRPVTRPDTNSTCAGNADLPGPRELLRHPRP